MRNVAIIGAGELGGATAHALARSNLVRSITLIDETRRVAVGKALDIAQAAPVEGFATQASGATDVSMAAGASIVILADRVTGGESQRELVDRGVRELKMARTRLFGSAPESLAAAVRALVALAVNGSPRDISLSVLGVPPAHTVIPWADATVAGFALTRLVDEPSRRRLGARVAALWPPGPYALAAAATACVDAMAGRSRRVASCFVAPDFSTGAHTRTGAMPVRLGPAGIVDVVLPSLSAVEQVALDNALML
jgi:malate/lactate dehydrogenase